MKEVKKCVICRKLFIAEKVNVKCCSKECGHINQMNMSREYHKREREAAAPGKKSKKNSLTDVAVAARNAGMTYGQYVAKMGL